MADDLIAERRVRPHHPLRFRLLVQYRMLPWWMRISLCYLLARVVTFGLLEWFAARQLPNSFTLQHPPYLSFASIWDGAWYKYITEAGYPSVLPVTNGQVGENAWAFMPAYPALVKALEVLTGAGFDGVAVAVSFFCGWGATLVFWKLMRRFLPNGSATFATVLFAVTPVAAMFQTAYAESMGLLLLMVALWLLVTRRYGWLIPVVLVLGFTRPSGLAMAMAIGLHVVHRWWIRERSPFPVRQGVTALVAAAVSGLAGLAWPAIAWAATGDRHAYTDTELAWRATYIGPHDLVAFEPWLLGLNWWFGVPWGAVLLGLVVVLFAGFMLSPWVRRLGIDIRLWALAYAVYLLAVFFPQSSTWRILLPMAPLLGALAVPRSIWYRVVLVVVSIGLQWVWMYSCWWVNGYDWTPP